MVTGCLEGGVSIGKGWGLTQPDNDASVYPLLCQVDVGLSNDGGASSV